MTTRAALLDRVEAEKTWDIVIIGGGATGLGAAVDAASRGYSTLLLEAGDFARGTSSRSTKLIHGGVRYLAQGNVKLVREALRERSILLRNAPHLVHRLSFLIPAESWPAIAYYAAGLKAYDLLAAGHGIGGSRPVGRSEAIRLAPTLATGKLRGGVLYRDGQFDDARLAIALMRTVLDLGGVALNGMPVSGLIKGPGGKVSGVEAVDSETGRAYRVAARSVVNATGVEVDAIRRLDDPGVAPAVAPSRGTHVVLDRSFLPGESAVMIPKTDDGRVLFAIPWRGSVILGTTDTPVDRVDREPRPSLGEIEYLLDHAGRYFATRPGVGDIRSAFAGLRPLVGKGGAGRTASLSREHAIFVSPSGLVTITGGKWTTYRRMGRDAVDRAVIVAALPEVPSATETLRLHGADAPELASLVAADPALGEPIHPGLTARKVDVVWAARREQARSVEDVLSRRTRSLFLDARASLGAAPAVAGLLAAELGKDAAWQAAQVGSFRDLALSYLPG